MSGDKPFCCTGCKMVYQILNEHELCDYYSYNNAPGLSQRSLARSDKFAYLDQEKIAEQLIVFRDDKQIHLNFYLPQIHCSSCLYLLEHLRKIDPGIMSSKVHFTEKEVDIVFDPAQTGIRKIVETLTSIGYEPYISLNDLGQKKPKADKGLIFQLGVAGFCFANIMLLSFPDYLGIDASETMLRSAFRWISVVLSVPVVFYAAIPFYRSAWGGIKHAYLNIDTPIALAILITFIRSMYEVISGTGGGFFDSLSGIVFFMLAGRILQDRTYRRLTFDRDYTSYFPIAVTVLKEEKEIPTALPEIKPGDTILIHNDEIIPVDGILARGNAFIDYSFVSGESLPVRKDMGSLLYAGGKQTMGKIELLVIKEVSQGYLTRLWNKETEEEKQTEYNSFINMLARFFSYILLGIAAITAYYWYTHDPARIWPAITAIFIIACPCALLLANSFTAGHFLRIFSRKNIYLRNSSVIDEIAATNHIVFDKTGTITEPSMFEVIWQGEALSDEQKESILTLTSQSSHPLSRAIAAEFKTHTAKHATGFSEKPGFGISGEIMSRKWLIGSAKFTGFSKQIVSGTNVYVSVNGNELGYFHFNNHYRENILDNIAALSNHYRISLISGDNDGEKEKLSARTGKDGMLLFNQSPEDKLNYIEGLRAQGDHVMMIGDGLNDAGALKKANTGIALCESINNFTPSSDVIMEAGMLKNIGTLISLAKTNRTIVLSSFALSLVYNVVGMHYAVQGTLSPLIAAILMPLSTISIITFTYLGSEWAGRKLR